MLAMLSMVVSCGARLMIRYLLVAYCVLYTVDHMFWDGSITTALNNKLVSVWNSLDADKVVKAAEDLKLDKVASEVSTALKDSAGAMTGSK